MVVAGLAACAAGVMLGLWLGGRDSNTPTPPDNSVTTSQVEFAKLSRKIGAVEVLNPTGETVPAEEGANLPPGFTLRTIGEDSLAVVELLRENARVEIEPDSVVRFASNATDHGVTSHMFLAAGQLTAAIPERPDDRPLVVATPVAEVFARGGTFIVSSAAPDSARVDIKHGNIELVRTDAPKPMSVGVGGAAVIRPGVGKVQIEKALAVDRVPQRKLTFPGPRHAVFSPDGKEVWVANARLFTRYPASGNPVDVSFYPRKDGDGIAAAFTLDKQFLLTFRGDRNDSVLVRTVSDVGEHAAINARLGADPRFWTVAPDAAWLAVVDPRPNNRRVRVLDGGTGNERFMREFEDMITCVAATPDGAALAVGIQDTPRGPNNKILFLDAETGEQLFSLPTQRKPLTAMTFSADGRYLAAGFNGMVQLWDVQTRELVRLITGFERALTCLAFSPDGKRLAAGTQDGHVWVWDRATGKHTQLIEVGGRVLRSVAFSPDGRQLVTVANAAGVTVWDVTDSTPPAGALE